MNQIDTLQAHLKKEQEKNKKLKQLNREKKREILAKLKELEEDIKDIMYKEED